LATQRSISEAIIGRFGATSASSTFSRSSATRTSTSTTRRCASRFTIEGSKLDLVGFFRLFDKPDGTFNIVIP
jgi:hypothetical protein